MSGEKHILLGSEPLPNMEYIFFACRLALTNYTSHWYFLKQIINRVKYQNV